MFTALQVQTTPPVLTIPGTIAVPTVHAVTPSPQTPHVNVDQFAPPPSADPPLVNLAHTQALSISPPTKSMLPKKKKTVGGPGHSGHAGLKGNSRAQHPSAFGDINTDPQLHALPETPVSSGLGGRTDDANHSKPASKMPTMPVLLPDDDTLPFNMNHTQQVSGSAVQK